MDVGSRWFKAAGASLIAAGIAARYVSKWRRGRELRLQSTGDRPRTAIPNRYFVGLDMVDPTVTLRRPCDVAVLDPDMNVQFCQWVYSDRGVSIVPDPVLGRAFVLAIDGPQGLAADQEATARRAETGVQRRVGIGVPGRTSYTMPSEGTPYGGFISGSIQLFHSLVTSGSRFRLLGMDGIAERDANLLEVYPGAGWRVLAGSDKLPRKDTAQGRRARKVLLEAQGVKFTGDLLPSTDQMDAAMAAWTAACFNEGRVTLDGTDPMLDESIGVIREGFIVQPVPLQSTSRRGEPPAVPT